MLQSSLMRCSIFQLIRYFFFIFRLSRSFLLQQRLCNSIQAFTGSDLLDEIRNIFIRRIQQGLYENLECCVATLHLFIFAIDAFAAVIGVWIVYALCVVYR